MTSLRTQGVVDAAFLRGDTVKVARALLSCVLCRRLLSGEILRLPVTETEAYHGFDDRASHAFRGRTARTEVMFGEAGHWYVYLCYGIHWMLNIVVGEKDFPAAVLLRGAGPWDGPAKLTKALGVTRALNAQAALPSAGLWLEWGEKCPFAHIKSLPRVGVDYAGARWKAKPWRFVRGASPRTY